MIPAQRPYTDADDERLRRLYPDLSNTKPDIAAKMDRSVSSIEKRATRLRISRQANIMPVNRPGPVPSDRHPERIAAEESAERIRAYYAKQGRPVHVEVVRVSHGAGKDGGWAARILTPIALGVRG